MHESTIHQEALRAAFKYLVLISNVRVSPEACLAHQCLAMHQSTIHQEAFKYIERAQMG